MAQSHYSACYWPLSHSAAQHWISQPQPALLPLWGIDWLLDFLRCSSHTLPPLPSIVLAPPCLPSIFPLSLSFSLSPYLSYSFSPSLCCLYSSSVSFLSRLSLSRPPSLSLSPLATVTAFSLDNRKPYLAVCSAQPWQSCQFTCLDCRILYPVSKTYCNYNPCISKCTWYTAMSDQHPVSYAHLFQMLYSTWFHIQQTLLFKCESTHYLPLVIEYLCERGAQFLVNI